MLQSAWMTRFQQIRGKSWRTRHIKKHVHHMLVVNVWIFTMSFFFRNISQLCNWAVFKTNNWYSGSLMTGETPFWTLLDVFPRGVFLASVLLMESIIGVFQSSLSAWKKPYLYGRRSCEKVLWVLGRAAQTLVIIHVFGSFIANSARWLIYVTQEPDCLKWPHCAQVEGHR